VPQKCAAPVPRIAHSSGGRRQRAEICARRGDLLEERARNRVRGLALQALDEQLEARNLVVRQVQVVARPHQRRVLLRPRRPAAHQPVRRASAPAQPPFPRRAAPDPGPLTLQRLKRLKTIKRLKRPKTI